MAQYTQEKYKEFALRAKEFIAKNPDASRKRVADYAGVHAGALDRLSKDDGFTMPKALTPQQTRRASNWGTILGELIKK